MGLRLHEDYSLGNRSGERLLREWLWVRSEHRVYMRPRYRRELLEWRYRILARDVAGTWCEANGRTSISRRIPTVASVSRQALCVRILSSIIHRFPISHPGPLSSSLRMVLSYRRLRHEHGLKRGSKASPVPTLPVSLSSSVVFEAVQDRREVERARDEVMERRKDLPIVGGSFR